MWKKQVTKGTVNNCNSKTSPGETHSGRPRTQRTEEKKVTVKAIMDRDSTKEIGDSTESPVNSARRNSSGMSKSSWSRVKLELKYHPYKLIRRQEL